MKARLLKKIRKRYKIVMPKGISELVMVDYSLIDNKNKRNPVYNHELESIKKFLIEWIKHDYPQSMTRSRVVEIWF